MIFRIDAENVDDIDGQIEEYLKDIYPIISDKAVKEILASKFINKFLINDSLGIVDIYAIFQVPKYYLEDKPQILWELNIPAFESHVFQIYNNDTILIDTWPNVVGKPSTKTYTGNYRAFRLRNWPSWKDPDAGDSVAATPPGPGNPLGLFVVHYDENSLRYFHGTNKNYLLKSEQRALSHGCVRNDNGNIEKMKQFILKRVIKSDDLSGWLGSKKSMIYEIKDEDKFPVRIRYKTFDIKTDEFGVYIVFYKDVYNYSGRAKLSKFDDETLITFSTLENILEDYKVKHFSNQIPDEKIIPIIENLLSFHKYNEKYYFNELAAGQNSN
ncbi:MAG: hypothetical protein EHM58_17340 [Ignavibacteriae bacterium]|nr:MAG: hypothetical protein EHM58_17340 [Ignavibacteriota bacterium]